MAHWECATLLGQDGSGSCHCYLIASCPIGCGAEPPDGTTVVAAGTSLRARAKSSLSLVVIFSATSVLAPRNFAPRLSCVVAQITSPSLLTRRTAGTAS